MFVIDGPYKFNLGEQGLDNEEMAKHDHLPFALPDEIPAQPSATRLKPEQIRVLGELGVNYSDSHP